MDFDDTPEEAAFRAGARAWLEANAFRRGGPDDFATGHFSGEIDTADYVKHKDGEPAPEDFLGNLETTPYNKNGDVIGIETQSPWLRPCAPGFRDLLVWLSKRYNYSPIDAYMLCSVCADLRISSIVDVPNWVVSFYFPRVVLD